MTVSNTALSKLRVQRIDSLPAVRISMRVLIDSIGAVSGFGGMPCLFRSGDTNSLPCLTVNAQQQAACARK